MFGEYAGSGNVFNRVGPRNIPNPNEWSGAAWAMGPGIWTFGCLGTGTDGGAEDWGNFNSFHNGLVQFAYGDGSVRGLKMEPGFTWADCSKYPILAALAGKADGVVVQGVD
jgi:prepilin-type processing-associated H-X9-DG protein